MKVYFFIIFILFLCGCSVVKQSSGSGFTSFNFELQYKGTSETVNLKGVGVLSSDSGYFNLYGPLGISVSKILICNDSISIIDLINKRIFKSNYVNLSKRFNNIFAGIFSEKEEQLVSSLCYLFLDKIKPEIFYDFDRGNTKQRINLSMSENENKHLVKIKMKPSGSIKMISGSSLSRYNYQIITVNLQ